MKKLFLLITILGSLNLSAQSVVQGTIGSAGATLNSDSGVQINFTLGQPFGEGEMSDSELTLVQGLQGANVNIEEGPDGTSGINTYSNLDAQILFDDNTGTLQLSGFNLDKISGNVFVSDLNGKVLQQSRIDGGQFQSLKLNGSADNLYIITVITEDNKRLSKKIIF